ncbi:hypothetical protein AB0N89_11990, partial [Amycolatopsis sp. NPDC089917]|uniref:hypothetical protein n=1 Tax=Amycolatopsis sp. NPDC089917 TaxID=3155187 RepID=UPI0034483F0D
GCRYPIFRASPGPESGFRDTFGSGGLVATSGSRLTFQRGQDLVERRKIVSNPVLPGRPNHSPA